MKPVRVRFAPSPTGYLHIGSLRTALFNWLFARHHKGTFVIRIEDTDVERSKAIYTASIIEDLQWMGLISDEPIIHQTERFPIYAQLVKKLLDEDKAYKDFYTQEEVIALYAQKSGNAEFIKAYEVCRNQPQDQNKPYVVRFKLPLEQQTICFHDLIRDEVCFEIEQLDDFVITRSDGSPTYNFVVVADDIEQRITHVIRGEDHISNTPKQLLLYQSFGQTAPQFAHLPLILGKDGQRLSKRDAATATHEYREAGYLPDALLNYLVRLGWSHGDQELFSRDELIKLFSIEEVGKKGAIFDQEKLDWLNGLYIRQSDNKTLLDLCEELHLDYGASIFNESQLFALIALYKERSKTVAALAHALKAFAYAPTAYDEASCKQWIDASTISLLQDVSALLSTIDDWHVDAIKEQITEYAKKEDKKLGLIAQPMRIALTGGSSSPGVFELLTILGKQESLTRLKRFIDR